MKPGVLSLPTGAGSIEGMGESFEPQLNTGGTTYGVPIAVPPGRAGLAPTIRLAYDSNQGNGLAGIGWSLEFASIKRQTDKGFPGYTRADTFVTGGEDLIPLDNAERHWRCRNERNFQRLRQIDTDGDGEDDAWEVTDRDGTRHLMGRFRGQGGRWSAVENPDASGTPFDRTYCWMVDETIDLHGNRIEYEYRKGSGVLYPHRIKYSQSGGNFQEVRFGYQERPDALEDYRPAFLTRLDKRLSRIESYSRGQLVRAHVLGYDWEPGDLTGEDADQQQGRIDLGVSLLKRIAQLDRTGDARHFLPPLVLTYSGMDLTKSALRSAIGAHGGGASLPELDLAAADGRVQLADVNGDGRPDLLATEPAGPVKIQKVCLNRGEEASNGETRLRFERARVVDGASPVDLSEPETVIEDVRGRGLVDVFQLTGQDASRRLEIYRNSASFDHVDETHMGFPSTNFESKPVPNPPGYVTFGSSATRRADVDFDKQGDFICLEAGFAQMEVRSYGTPRGGPWREINSVLPASYPLTATFQDATGAPNPAVQLADMNGDRLPDLVYLDLDDSGSSHRLSIRYWPLVAAGKFGTEHAMKTGLSDSIDIGQSGLQSVQVADVTGDGLADVFVLDGTGAETRITLVVNLAGHAWSPPYKRGGLPPYRPGESGHPTVFRLADVNASGTTDLIFRNTGASNTWHYLELLPSGKPGLLTGIDNSLGKRTTIVYGSAGEDEQWARAAGHPWRTSCPVPLQVVRQIRVTSSLDLNGDGKHDTYAAAFRYRDPYYDGLEREFRGFAFAQRVDVGDDFLADAVTGLLKPTSGWDTARSPTGQVSGPSLVTRMRFHTGAPDGIDNDEYSTTSSDVRWVDEFNEKAGREEEPLKGCQLVEEKSDPRLLVPETLPADAEDPGFDASCERAALARTFEARGKLAPDDYVYTREYQEWTVRRLYRPAGKVPYHTLTAQGLEAASDEYVRNPIAPVPAGRFAAAGVGVSSSVCGSVSFAFVSRYVTEIREANGVMATSLGYHVRDGVQVIRTLEYDDYGNTTAELNFGMSAGGTDDERFTRTGYALAGEALARWIINKPASVSVTDEKGNFVSRKTLLYDGPDFVGLPEGQLGARALLSRQAEHVDSARTIATARSRYDGHGNVVETLDGKGGRHQVVYDEAFRSFPVEERVIVGGGAPDIVFGAEYDLGLGVMTVSIDPAGPKTLYQYDSYGRLVRIASPGDNLALPTRRFEYQPVDPARNIIYFYKDDGSVVKEPLPQVGASRVVTYTRVISGQPAELITATYLDGCGKALAEVEAGENPGTWVVKSATSFNLRQQPSAKWSPYQVESPGLPGFNQIWPDGRPPVNLVPPPVATDTFSDPLGRGIRDILPAETWGGPRLETAFRILPLEIHLPDVEGLRAGSVHAGSGFVRFQDGLGRLVRVDELVNDPGLGALVPWTTLYTYDLNDQLGSVRDSQGNLRTWTYDGLKRQIAVADPDRGTILSNYDDASNLISSIDAKGQQIQFTYDGANRLKTESFVAAGHGAVPEVEYFYDLPAAGLNLGNGQQGMATFTAGRLAHVRDGSGETHFSYDARGRVIAETKRLSVMGGGLKSWTTGYQFDARDQLLGIVLPDGDTVAYDYNARGLLSGVRSGSAGPIVSGIHYQPSGQQRSITHGNGVVSTYTYDPRLRLGTQRTGKDSVSPLLDLAYSFDGNSSVTRINDRRIVDPALNDTRLFAYDDLRRLTGVVYPTALGGAPGSIDYRYDRIGNMVSQTSTIPHQAGGLPVANLGSMASGGALGTSNRKVRNEGDSPGPHALSRLLDPTGTALDYEYDVNGNLVAAESGTYTWDYKDRLAGVENAAFKASYRHDYAGRRVARSVVAKANPAQPARTIWYISREFEVEDGVRPVKYIWAGDIRVARITPGDTVAGHLPRLEFYHLDHIGSSSVITDRQGIAVCSILYYPFGHPRIKTPDGSDRERYQFTGKELDAESGWNHFEARYLSGRLARFTQVDPLATTPSTLKTEQPQRWNSYAYAGNSPLVNLDPTGLEFKFSMENAMGCIQGVGNTIAGAGCASFAVATSTSGIGAVAGYAGMTFFADQAAADFRQCFAGTRPETVFSLTMQWGGATPEAAHFTETVVGVLGGAAMTVGQLAASSTPKISGTISNLTVTGTASGAESSLQGSMLRMQLAAEEVAGARLPQTLTGYTRHGLNQAISRDGVGVSASAILNAFKNPTSITGQTGKLGGAFQMLGENAGIVVNPQGRIITTWGTSSAGIRSIVAP